MNTDSHGYKQKLLRDQFTVRYKEGGDLTYSCLPYLRSSVSICGYKRVVYS